jgi:beta-glucosidase
MDTLQQHVDNLVEQLTLEEKASLCSGRDQWSFKSVNRLDIPSVWLADGPHGLRKAPDSAVPGFGNQHPSTCFPTASALAASWDSDLLRRVGKYIALECLALSVHVILGPGVNIKRSPTGGRNFEYFSEDPILSGELGAAYIDGVQAEGVGTSLKHYACNSQETQRMVASAEISERALREIYLPNFEIAVTKSQPWTVMAAYNPINGVDATANKYLLNDILKNEWGYEGIVVSDWVSVFDRVEGVKAGMHVEMPGNSGINDAKLVAAVKQGTLAESELDKLVKETLKFVFKAKAGEKKNAVFDSEQHHSHAREVAAETFVLLKNDNTTLPITNQKYSSIALLGQLAVAPRFQGNGSSEVKPTRTDNLKAELTALVGDEFQLEFSQGYKLDDDDDMQLIPAAVEAAARADVAILHVGLPSHYESEGYDRKHIDLPPVQVKLIEEVAKVQPNTVLVLTNGAAIAMPFADSVAAILETWLCGQAGAGAIAQTLLGIANPSGKLAETFPVRLEDTPGFLDFPGLNRRLNYGEGIFVGYRWYDTRKLTPLFSFGHGLSYTTFEYSNLVLSSSTITDSETLEVSCTIKNTGKAEGKEVVQLYVSDRESRLVRPVKELKGFVKIALAPGQESFITFELNPRDFSYYDEAIGSWVAESGEFDVHVAASSQDIRLSDAVTMDAQQSWPVNFDERTTLREWIQYPETRAIIYTVVKDFFMQNPAEFEGDLMEFNIKNDFFLDFPMMKYVVVSEGGITEQQIADALKAANQLTFKL